jgi:hypothetical protein
MFYPPSHAENEKSLVFYHNGGLSFSLFGKRMMSGRSVRSVLCTPYKTQDFGLFDFHFGFLFVRLFVCIVYYIIKEICQINDFVTFFKSKPLQDFAQ